MTYIPSHPRSLCSPPSSAERAELELEIADAKQSMGALVAKKDLYQRRIASLHEAITVAKAAVATRKTVCASLATRLQDGPGGG